MTFVIVMKPEQTLLLSVSFIFHSSPKKTQTFRDNQFSVTDDPRGMKFCLTASMIAVTIIHQEISAGKTEMCNNEVSIRPHEERCGWKMKELVLSVGVMLSGWQLKARAPKATKSAVTQSTSVQQ